MRCWKFDLCDDLQLVINGLDDGSVPQTDFVRGTH